jgi:hypothetical protein
MVQLVALAYIGRKANSNKTEIVQGITKNQQAVDVLEETPTSPTDRGANRRGVGDRTPARRRAGETPRQKMTLILLIVLIVALVGGLPKWGYHDLGYGPAKFVGAILLAVLILVLMGWL